MTKETALRMDYIVVREKMNMYRMTTDCQALVCVLFPFVLLLLEWTLDHYVAIGS